MLSSEIYKILNECMEMKKVRMFETSADEKKKLSFGISQLKKVLQKFEKNIGVMTQLLNWKTYLLCLNYQMLVLVL